MIFHSCVNVYQRVCWFRNQHEQNWISTYPPKLSPIFFSSHWADELYNFVQWLIENPSLRIHNVDEIQSWGFLFEEISKKYWQSVCFFLQDVFDPISVAPTPILAPCLLVISQLINPHWSSSRHVDAIWLKSNVCKLDPNIVSYQNNSPTTRMCSHCHIAKSLTPIVFITYS